MAEDDQTPSPELFWQIITGFQMSAALKAAIDLKLFTRIGEGHGTTPALAAACGVAERGIRILADTVTVLGFLTKSNGTYALTASTSVFLVETSPAYRASAADFLLHPTQKCGFDDLTNAVRNGGTMIKDDGSVDPESPMWATFARSMTGMMMPAARQHGSRICGIEPDRNFKVLDIAAGHGMFGITRGTALSECRDICSRLGQRVAGCP